jgi:hypothetical protein
MVYKRGFVGSEISYIEDVRFSEKWPQAKECNPGYTTQYD